MASNNNSNYSPNIENRQAGYSYDNNAPMEPYGVAGANTVSGDLYSAPAVPEPAYGGSMLPAGEMSGYGNPGYGPGYGNSGYDPGFGYPGFGPGYGNPGYGPGYGYPGYDPGFGYPGYNPGYGYPGAGCSCGGGHGYGYPGAGYGGMGIPRFMGGRFPFFPSPAPF